jgi:hypothetical protein
MKPNEPLDDELRELSPWLRGLPRHVTPGTPPPPGYFEGLEESVFDKIEAQGARRPAPQAGPGTVLRRWLNPRYMMAVAASLTLVLAAWWFLRPQPQPLDAEQYAAALSEEDLETYLMDNIHEFEAAQLAQLPLEDLAEAEINAETPGAAAPKNEAQSDDFSPEDLDHLLEDMSEEELESML